jgi:hypothetical protein
MIRSEIDRWSELPEDSRGELVEHIRSYLEEQIPPSERKINRGGEYVDAINYILGDLEHYG